MLKKEQILKFKPQLTEVTVSCWGGSVYMRQLSAAAVLFIQSIEDNRAEFLQTLALTSICNEDGSPMFSDDDRDFLADQPVSVYNDLVAGFLLANHLTDPVIEDDKEELKKTASSEHVTEYLS